MSRCGEVSVRAGSRAGFTLAELVVIVVVFGVLSAMVLPRVASARTEAAKTEVLRVLSDIDRAAMAYGWAHGGRLVTEDPELPMREGGAHGGFGIVATAAYLGGVPVNAYTGASVLVEGSEDEVSSLGRGSGRGFVYEVSEGVLMIGAVGYERSTDRLAHEAAEGGTVGRDR